MSCFVMKFDISSFCRNIENLNIAYLDMEGGLEL